MKVTIDWLKDFVDIDIPARELADKLVSVGFEVEEIVDPRENIKNVVLGKILSIVKHPDADKLVVCQIDVGGEILQIVTGANNIAEGDLVPVAKDASLLPGGKTIKKGKLRGVESCGMLCSGEELGLTEADYPGAGVYGILIMNGESAPLGTDINDVLGNTDVVLDIGVTANRPDCNSVYGIAGEIAAVLKKPLRAPKTDFTAEKNIKTADIVSVDVRDSELCPRYMAAAVTDIRIAPSPEYVRRRLKAVGLRKDGPELIACPTCGRTQIDLIPMAHRVEELLRGVDKPLTVAVMGCVVNGPGEARHADVGIAGGKGEGVLFLHGEIVDKVPEDQLIPRLMELIDTL